MSGRSRFEGMYATCCQIKGDPLADIQIAKHRSWRDDLRIAPLRDASVAASCFYVLGNKVE